MSILCDRVIHDTLVHETKIEKATTLMRSNSKRLLIFLNFCACFCPLHPFSISRGRRLYPLCMYALFRAHCVWPVRRKEEMDNMDINFRAENNTHIKYDAIVAVALSHVPALWPIVCFKFDYQIPSSEQ